MGVAISVAAVGVGVADVGVSEVVATASALGGVVSTSVGVAFVAVGVSAASVDVVGVPATSVNVNTVCAVGVAVSAAGVTTISRGAVVTTTIGIAGVVAMVDVAFSSNSVTIGVVVIATEGTSEGVIAVVGAAASEVGVAVNSESSSHGDVMAMLSSGSFAPADSICFLASTPGCVDMGGGRGMGSSSSGSEGGPFPSAATSSDMGLMGGVVRLGTGGGADLFLSSCSSSSEEDSPLLPLLCSLLTSVSLLSLMEGSRLSSPSILTLEFCRMMAAGLEMMEARSDLFTLKREALFWSMSAVGELLSKFS